MVNLSQEDADFIWSLLPEWVKDGPGDIQNPMFLGTLTNEGDIKVHKKVCKLLNQKSNG